MTRVSAWPLADGQTFPHITEVLSFNPGPVSGHTDVHRPPTTDHRPSKIYQTVGDSFAEHPNCGFVHMRTVDGTCLGAGNLHFTLQVDHMLASILLLFVQLYEVRRLFFQQLTSSQMQV